MNPKAPSLIMIGPDGQSLKIHTAYQNPDMWELLEVGNTTLMVARPGAASPETGRMSDILSYMDCHLSEQLTLAQVAGHFEISVSTLTQLFQKHLAVSFHQYLTQRRMAASIPLLLSDMPLEQICRQVGYRNYSTFFRAFKQVFHISPREFRKANSRAPFEPLPVKRTMK